MPDTKPCGTTAMTDSSPRLLDADKVVEVIEAAAALHKRLGHRDPPQPPEPDIDADARYAHLIQAASLYQMAARIRSLPSQGADTPGAVERLRDFAQWCADEFFDDDETAIRARAALTKQET